MSRSVRVVVIGGAGFIGTWLCEALEAKGVSFFILDKVSSATFPNRTLLADVRDVDSLRRVMVQCDVIINLAAEHRDDVHPPSLYQEVNVLGAENICCIAREFGVERLIFTSSVACYGYANPMTGEDGQLNPFNEYGRTKQLAEQVFLSWRNEKSGRRDLLIVRPTVVFGERNRGNVYNLLHMVAVRKFVMIGSGRNVKSMAYVGNLVAFIAHMLDNLNGLAVVNYVDEPQMEVREIVAVVRSTLGYGSGVGIRLPLWVGIVAGYVADLIAIGCRISLPISLIRVRKFVSTSSYSTRVSDFGFSAPVSLHQALEGTIRHEFIDRTGQGPIFVSE